MAVPSVAPQPVPVPNPTRRWLLMAVAALILFGGSALAALWWQGSDPPDATGLAVSPHLFVLQRGGIEVVDPVGGRILGRLPRPNGYPHAFARDAAGRFHFFLDGESVVAYQVDGYQQVASFALPAWPRRVAVSPSGSTIAVSLALDPAIRILRWDGAAFWLERELLTDGEPGALHFDQAGNTLFIGLEDGVAAVDLETGAERFRAPLAKPHQIDPVRKLLLGADGQLYAYYINWDHLGAVALISPAGTTVTVREFGRVIHDIALAPNGQTLYATWRTPVGEMPRRGGLIALESATLATVRPELDLGWAMGVAVSPDGRTLYVTEGRRPFRWEFDFPGRLVRVDAASFQVLESQPVGRGPQFIATNY